MNTPVFAANRNWIFKQFSARQHRKLTVKYSSNEIGISIIQNSFFHVFHSTPRFHELAPLLKQRINQINFDLDLHEVRRSGLRGPGFWWGLCFMCESEAFAVFAPSAIEHKKLRYSFNVPGRHTISLLPSRACSPATSHNKHTKHFLPKAPLVQIESYCIDGRERPTFYPPPSVARKEHTSTGSADKTPIRIITYIGPLGY